MPDREREDRSRPPTIEDIARRAGVSTATVSFVINDRADGRVSATTQARVRGVADELGYVTDSRARALRRGHSDLVVLQLDDALALEIPMSVGLSKLASDLREAGYTFVAHGDVGRRGLSLARLWAEMRPAAVIAPSSMLSGNEIEMLQRIGSVVVGLGSTADASIPTVCFDEEPVGRLAVEHLVERGCERITMVTAGDGGSCGGGSGRARGAEAAAARAGLVFDVVAMGAGATAAAAVVAPWRPGTAGSTGVPDGVVGSTSAVAGQLSGALLDIGIDPGPGMALVSLDDDPLCQMLRPRLTAIGYREADDQRLVVPVIAAIEKRWRADLGVLCWPPVLQVRDT